MAVSPKAPSKRRGCVVDASSQADTRPVGCDASAPFEGEAFAKAADSLVRTWKSGHAAVALSGGADSAILAVVADHVARQRGCELLLLHVNHGLLPQAQAWVAQVQDLARQLARPIDILEVDVGSLSGRGMEAAARDARYSALLAACERHGVSSLLLAHHQDDQAETVLLRLLRGAGVAGLAAMAPSVFRGKVQLLRPWLNVPRIHILELAQSFAQRTGWHAVSDPTNTDARYTRAAVRTRLTPVLNERWPGWQAILGRHARQAQEAASILQEVADSDLAAIVVPGDGSPDVNGSLDVNSSSVVNGSPDVDGPATAKAGRPFSLAAWRRLSEPRQRNVLRHWLAKAGARMPSEARLRDLQRQLNQLHSLGHDRNLVFDHSELRVRCVRGIVMIEARSE